ncbi:MAG: hypothetical protein WAW37_14535 [Syntrophobacteraceae bacterium]
MTQMLFYLGSDSQVMPIVVGPFDKINRIFHRSLLIFIEKFLRRHTMASFVNAKALGYGNKSIYGGAIFVSFLSHVFLTSQ